LHNGIINTVKHGEKREKGGEDLKKKKKRKNSQYGVGLHQRFTQLLGYISKAET
jgi:hypothetical protein